MRLCHAELRICGNVKITGRNFLAQLSMDANLSGVFTARSNEGRPKVLFGP